LSFFTWLIPSGLPLLNVSYVLDAHGASIYISHHLERMTNNMEQTFVKEKHFHVNTTLKPFGSHNIIPK
jgi:hypothetical protein